MGGKPSKGTPADRRLKTNRTPPAPKAAPMKAQPVKAMPAKMTLPVRRGGRRG